MMEKKLYIISVLGRDRPGLIASVTGVLANARANIIDIDQVVLRGLLAMFMIVDYSTSKVKSEEVNSMLKDKAKELGITIDVEPYIEYMLTTEPEKKVKDLVLVTILGKDKPGIVHSFSDLFYHLGTNIERIRMIARGEIIVTEYLVDTGDMGWSDLRGSLQKRASKVGMNIVFQPRDVFKRAKKLVVFDMDSTLVDAEIIDEIAKSSGVEERIRDVTRAAMNGEIEFEDALRERVKLLKGLDVKVLEDIAENTKLTPGAEELLATLKELGYKVALISGGFTFFTDRLKEKFNLNYAYANDLDIKDGKLTGKLKGRIIDAEAKRDIMKEIAAKEGLEMDEVIAIGDGANDRYLVEDAGLGIAFNPKKVLKKYADGVLTDNNIKGLLYCLGDYREKVLKKE